MLDPFRGVPRTQFSSAPRRIVGDEFEKASVLNDVFAWETQKNPNRWRWPMRYEVSASRTRAAGADPWQRVRTFGEPRGDERLAHLLLSRQTVQRTPNMKLPGVLLAVALAGCASTADIDLSKVETTCGQTCSRNYSECVSRFSFTPIIAQNTCTDALKLCAQSCPPR